jgi:uncharacterized DUF497 family protein
VHPAAVIGRASGFDWDEGNRAKCLKHGVSVQEIEALLASDPLIAPDLKHSAVEDRLIAVGRNAVGRPLFVAFTLRTARGRTLVRPVSARYMHAQEIDAYEKGAQAQDR